MPATDLKGTGIFFRCRQMPFNTGTWCLANHNATFSSQTLPA